MGRRDAALALGLLLADPELPYRGMWASLGTSPRRGRQLNRASVGRIIAAHLVDTHHLDDIEEKAWPRAKKDWLNRCLDGARPEDANALNREALGLFCDAFAMSACHRTQLLALWESSSGARTLGRPAPATRERTAELPAREYHSVWVLEEHFVGADRRPLLHRTTQTVEADVDDLRRIIHKFDADCVAVDVERGGRASGDIMLITEGLWGQPIVLDEPAARGEHRDLVYTTYFHHTEEPPPEFRRSGGSDPHADTEIRVHFHPDSVPAEVCHCVWPALDERPLTEAVVELDDTRSAAEVFNILQPGSLVGFRWSWPEAT